MSKLRFILLSITILLVLLGCKQKESCEINKVIISSPGKVDEIRQIVFDQLNGGDLSSSQKIHSPRPGLIGSYSVRLDPRFIQVGLHEDTDERVVVSPEGQVVAVFLARTRLEGIVVNTTNPPTNNMIPPAAMTHYSDEVALVCINRD